MKLEEILPHLRAGGRVTYSKNTQEVEYNLKRLLNCLSYIELESDYFEIVKEPYKKEYTVKATDGDYIFYWDKQALVPLQKLPKNTKYKITIEEITE